MQTERSKSGLIFQSRRCMLLFLACASVNAINMSEPPGCGCTMARCCSGEAQRECQLLDNHIGLTSAAGDKATFCKPFLEGTKDGNMTVCDAIIQDQKFSERFMSGAEGSMWVQVAENATCAEFEASSIGTCPNMTEHSGSLSSSWTSLVSNECARLSLGLGNDTSKLVNAEGCSGDKGVANILAGIFSPQEADKMPGICPAFPTFTFSDVSANGMPNKRWMCHDALYSGSPFVNGVQEFPQTTWRMLYVNLGNLPCGGSELPQSSMNSALDYPQPFEKETPSSEAEETSLPTNNGMPPTDDNSHAELYAAGKMMYVSALLIACIIGSL